MINRFKEVYYCVCISNLQNHPLNNLIYLHEHKFFAIIEMKKRKEKYLSCALCIMHCKSLSFYENLYLTKKVIVKTVRQI